jgi:glycosyltransferase involved in cell wall biosynthesis
MPATNPKISVLLPVWNAGSTLQSCLRSVQRQTETDFECIVINDGSTDDSLAIARSFASRDPRFQIFDEPHAGLIPSLEKGVEHCGAEIIARMDADDWMHRDRLRLQSAALDAHPELDAVGCFVRIFPRQGLLDGRRAYERWLHSMRNPETIWRERFVECPVAHPSLMIRKQALVAHPYRDRGWPEDYDLLLRLLRKGPKIGMVEQRLVGWRDHPQRLSRTHENYELDRFTACRAWHLSRDFLEGCPRYVLWGHGRTGRALRRALTVHGHQPELIVDVHPRRIGQRIHGAEVISPEALSQHEVGRLVASVAGPGPRKEIRAALDSMGFREGSDYIFAA